MLTQNLNLNISKTLFALQTCLNNADFVITETSSNEQLYDFKVRDVLSTLIISDLFANKLLAKSSKNLADKRLIYAKKIADATFFVNAKTKIYYDARHKFLLLKFNDKIYLKLHHEYILSEKNNKKLNNQRTESFYVKRRVNKLAYELNLLSI